MKPHKNGNNKSQIIQKRGLLMVLKKQNLIAGRQSMFFELRGGVLMMYKSEAQKGNSNNIFLENAKLQLATNSSTEFIIETSNKEVYNFQANNEKELKEWIESLT